MGRKSRWIVAVLTIVVLTLAGGARAGENEGRREVAFAQPAGGGDALPLATGAGGDAGMRRVKAARYERLLQEPLAVDGAPQRIALRTEWWKGVAPLPVAQSDVIVVGEITNAAAYLTKSGSGLYSEFTIRVVENVRGVPAGTRLLTADRAGGALLHKDGWVSSFTIAHQGMPQLGGKYLLFLRDTGSGLEIVTGYGLSTGRVLPLDGRRATLGFERHAGLEVNAFLGNVRSAIAKRSQEIK